MPAIDDEDRPKKKLTHEIGQEVNVVYVRDGKEEKAKVKLVGVE